MNVLNNIFSIFFISIMILFFVWFNKNYETMEGMGNSLLINKNDAFCESHRGKSTTLNENCGKLTEQNCNTTSCCVWASPGKCLAGDEKGPLFNSDTNGKTMNLDYYYYQNKCYGKNCS